MGSVGRPQIDLVALNTTIILSGPLFGHSLHRDSTWTIYSGRRKGAHQKVANWQLCHSVGRVLDLKFALYLDQWESGKPEMRPSSHQAVGKWTSRTLFFQSNGIKCNDGRVESPAMWVFALPWDVWSCEFTSGASEVGVGRQALA